MRAAQAADLPALHRIFVESSLSNPGDAANLLAHPEVLDLGPIHLPSGRTRVVVDDDGCVAGFATVTPGDGVFELEDLFVAPVRMRRGAGSALVGEVAELARAAGARRIDVTANPHALAFYTHAGFVHDGDTTTPFGPAPRMHLDLAALTSRGPAGIMFAGSRQREATMDDAVPGQAFRRVPDGYDPDAVDDRLRELQRSLEAARARRSLAEQASEALRAQLLHRASPDTDTDTDTGPGTGTGTRTGTRSGTGHQGLATRIEQLLALAEDQAADLLAAAEREAGQLVAWAEHGQSPENWAQARGELQAQLEAELRPIVQAQLESALRAERARDRGGLQDCGRDRTGTGGGWFRRRRAARSPGRTAF